jgi:hypothetical protein
VPNPNQISQVETPFFFIELRWAIP